MASSRTNVASILGSTPIAAAAFSTLMAATLINCTKIILANGTDQNVTLCTGLAGSEVAWISVAKGTTISFDIAFNTLPIGTRLSVVGELVATTSGSFTASLIP